VQRDEHDVAVGPAHILAVLEAYDYFLRGQAALLTRTREDNETAREMYRRALALDPAFARAYAGLALAYAADYRQQWTGSGPQALARARELAETAARIDAEILEVQWVLAYVDAQSRRHEQAIAHLNRAIALDPSFADAYALLGSIRTDMGQPAKAIPLVRTAIPTSIPTPAISRTSRSSAPWCRWRR
jgi:tetratricopeptide (TPR) repeat protein